MKHLQDAQDIIEALSKLPETLDQSETISACLKASEVNKILVQERIFLTLPNTFSDVEEHRADALKDLVFRDASSGLLKKRMRAFPPEEIAKIPLILRIFARLASAPLDDRIEELNDD